MSPSLQTMGFFMSDINFCNTKEQLNHLGEVVTGKVDGSPSGADIDTSTLPYTGQVRKTLPALEAEYQDDIDNFVQVSDQVITDKTAEFDQSIADKEAEADQSRVNTELLAEQQRDNIESTFTAQFAYKRIGNISLYVGNSLPEVDKLNSYQFPDDSGEWYGPVQDQSFPITIPVNPSTDDGWTLVSSLTGDWGGINTGIEVKHRRGNTSEIDNFTPAVAELIVDTDNSSLIVGDGVTPGGSVVSIKPVDNVAKLKLGKYRIGDIVKTKGYITPGDGQQGEYLIVPPQTADGFVNHELVNGNVATLMRPVNSELEVKVPSDFSNIPAAIDYLSTFVHGDNGDGVAEIILESGFEWRVEDNILAENVDYRQIRISSEDAVVSVESGYTGAPLQAERAIAPQWNILLDMNGLGLTGLYLVQNSDCYVGPNSGSGVINAGVDGVFVNRVSNLYAHESKFYGAARYGMFADHNASIYARHAEVYGCLTNVKVRSSSYANLGRFGSEDLAANLSGATGSGTEGNGISVERASRVEANGANMANCNNRGVYVQEGATCVIEGPESATVSGCPLGIVATEDSKVYALGVIADGCNETVSATLGSFANVINGTLTNATNNAITVDSTSKVIANGADTSGAIRQPTKVTAHGGVIHELNITHEYRKASSVISSNDVGLFSTNEKVRLRFALDTDLQVRLSAEVRLSAGKSSSGSGRGGAAYVIFSAGASANTLQDLVTTELQVAGFNAGEITLTHTGANNEFDITVLNPNSANSDGWAWTIEVETLVSAIDASNRIPNLKFIEAVVEAV